MQSKSGEWWNYSWNFAPGCTKVSPECDNCWALAMAKRLQGMKKPGYVGLVDPRGQWTGKVSLMDAHLEDPLRQKKPRVIAVNLMGDLYHPEVPDEFIGRVFGVMAKANWHTYMVLTKRAERMVNVMKRIKAFADVLPHVWLGTTAGTQWSANTRWSSMMLLAQNGWNTWVSSGPRLEAIDWHGWSFLKLMATEGESGPYARPMSPAWPRADRDWCQAHGVPFHFKQWGEWGPYDVWKEAVKNDRVDGYLADYSKTKLGGEMLFRYGRKLAGRVLDGQVYNGLESGQTDESGRGEE